jgi:hypothetical protein
MGKKVRQLQQKKIYSIIQRYIEDLLQLKYITLISLCLHGRWQQMKVL